MPHGPIRVSPASRPAGPGEPATITYVIDSDETLQELLEALIGDRRVTRYRLMPRPRGGGYLEVDPEQAAPFEELLLRVRCVRTELVKGTRDAWRHEPAVRIDSSPVLRLDGEGDCWVSAWVRVVPAPDDRQSAGCAVAWAGTGAPVLSRRQR